MAGASSRRGVNLAQAACPICWVVVTITTALAAYLAILPRSCIQVERCQAFNQEFPNVLNGNAFCGLVTVFMHEVTSLCLNYKSARPIMGLINGIEDVFVPPLLLCITFVVLVLENAIFMSRNMAAVFAHVAVDGAMPQANQPVYTAIYVEWLINVPLLLVLAGNCALGRPLRQLAGPVVATNVYIIIAWSAHFILDARLRWTLVAVSFAMYGWSSYKMSVWVLEYLRSTKKDAPSRTLRPCLAVGLIVVFGIYGLVYLCAMLGMITVYVERVSYICMNIGVKLMMSIAFAGIRSSEYTDLLIDMLVNTHLPFQRQIACSLPRNDEKEGFANSESETAADPLLRVKAP